MSEAQMPEERPYCECSDEYGPCEQHGTILVSRDGAALRNPDEQVMQLIGDLLDVGAELSSWGHAEYLRLRDSLMPDEMDNNHFTYPEDYGCADWLATQLEGTIDAYVILQPDGYVIVDAHHDCPLLEG
jgi:hypothetical protein